MSVTHYARKEIAEQLGSHVVVCGPTASGKTALVEALATRCGLNQFRISDWLVAMGVSRWPRRERLLSWRGESAHSRATENIDRIIDLTTLIGTTNIVTETVVESAVLPWVLSPINNSLIINLGASEAVRARRLQRRSPELDLEQTLAIVARTDAVTTERIRAAWGIDLEASATEWRSDLVLACPDPVICSDPHACKEAILCLAVAAVGVYRLYFNEIDDEYCSFYVDTLRKLVDQNHEVVKRINPLLLESGPFALERWQRRLLTDLPTIHTASDTEISGPEIFG